MAFQQQLEAFLRGRKLDLTHTKRSWISDCVSPSCGKKAHMYIQKSDGRSICFKCGTTWSWVGLVSRIAGVSKQQARELIFGVGAGDVIDQALDPALFEMAGNNERTSDEHVTLGPDFVPVDRSDVAVSYLLSRGITNPRLILDYDLRYQGFMNAVVFPVRRDGRIYGWQARKISPKPGELRLISHTFNKSRFLLNYDRARTCKSLILVEGPFDCLHVDVEDFGAVASLGKGVSQEQIKLILDSQAKDVYIGLDPDAYREVYEVFSRIGLGRKVLRVLPPQHRKDFGESSYDEVVDSIRNAVPMTGSDYLEAYFN